MAPGIGAILTGAGAGGLMNLVSSKYESDLQARKNREAFDKNRAFELEKYGLEKQYSDELWGREKAYNLELWNMQNAYNTPAAQMQRFREAGLNPNLIYGQGNPGNASVVHSTSPGRPSMGEARLEPTRYELKNRQLMDYVGIRNQLLAGDLLKSQKNRVDEDTRDRRRENELLERTGFGRRDPWHYKLLGRFLRWYIGQDWDKSNKNILDGKIQLVPSSGKGGK